jgi:hypothetical protein
MNEAQHEQLGQLLQHAAEFLDIPDALYEEAVAKYEGVGNWLEEQDSESGRTPPEIYPQGSFRLGTVIRPLTDKDEYDIDLVYRRGLKKESTTQKKLKAEAGEHLRSYVQIVEAAGNTAPILDEGRRCWTLTFDNRFHMDVLPAIPDGEGRPESILVTDRELREWQFSNPIGYAEWFKTCMRAQFVEQRGRVAAMLKEAAEQVPDWKVKTPLQRAVQILKRHRDFYFQNDHDNRPVSIIITTLAAHAYRNQANLYDALLAIVRDMPKYIEMRESVAWVTNPVNPKENFADKWQANPERAGKFYTWLQRVEDDFTAARSGEGIPKIVHLLGRSLGETTMVKAAAAYGRGLHQQQKSGLLTMAAGTGMLLAGGSVKVKEHTFYGELDKTEDA